MTNKRLKVLQKETVTMTPNKTQDFKPGQTLIVHIPYVQSVQIWSFFKKLLKQEPGGIGRKLISKEKANHLSCRIKSKES